MRKTVENTSIWDDEMSEWYMNNYGNLAMHRKIPLLCQVQNGETVLDIGCAGGTVVIEVAKHLAAGKVIGIDPSPKMIEAAEKNVDRVTLNTPIELFNVGAESLPLNDASIDVAIAVSTLHHWGNVEAGLKETLRVLKPQGRFFVIDDLWHEDREAVQALIEQEGHRFEGVTNHCELVSADSLLGVLSEVGFSDLNNVEYRAQDIAVSIVTAYKPKYQRGKS